MDHVNCYRQASHDFRVTAGIEVTSKSLGGWEAMDSELRGTLPGM